MGTNWEFWAYDFILSYHVGYHGDATKNGVFCTGVDDALGLSALHVYCIRDNCAVLCHDDGARGQQRWQCYFRSVPLVFGHWQQATDIFEF
jgi:hypothetical protein